MIYILWATVRPEKFIKNHKIWMRNADIKKTIKTLVAVNTEEHKEILQNYNIKLDITVCGDCLGVCEPIYYLTKNLKAKSNDIVVVVCDDVECIESWDTYFVSLFLAGYQAVFLNDGVQDVNLTTNPPITMPLMNIKTLRILNNIIFHPSYMHYFADNELYLNLMELGLLKDLRSNGVVFQHQHYDIGKRKRDEVDNKIISKCGNKDRENYYRRIKFPVEERIKL